MIAGDFDRLSAGDMIINASGDTWTCTGKEKRSGQVWATLKDPNGVTTTVRWSSTLNDLWEENTAETPMALAGRNVRIVEGGLPDTA